MRLANRQRAMAWVLGGTLVAYCAFVGASEPTLHFGFQHGTDKNYGYLNFIKPLPRMAGGDTFLDLRLVASSNETQEFNLGLGYRRSVRDGNALAGAYAFYDRRRSMFDNTFHQLTLGVDYLSTPLDARLNLYLPGNHSEQVGVTAPYFGPTGITQDVMYEETQPGFDIEFGTELPGLSRWLETRAYVGWVQFKGDRTLDTEGPQARLEVYPMRGVRLAAGTRELRQTRRENFVELRVSMPLSVRGWHDLAQVFKAGAAKSRTLFERRYEPPVRDIDIVTRTASSPALIQPLVYVNNQSTSATEDGTLANPYRTVQPGIDAATSAEWVYVSGSGTAYSERITVPANTTLLGSGYRYMGLGGGVYPVLDGGGAGHVIELADNTTVMGMEVRNSGASASGFHAVDVDGIALIANRATGNGTGALIEHTGTSSAQSVLIQGNAFHDNSLTGIRLVTVDSAQQAALLRGNQLYRNSYFGLHLESGGGQQSIALESNTLTANGVGGLWASSVGGGQSVDLGAGVLGASGQNRLFGNAVYELANDSGSMISAAGTWWGGGAPVAGQITLGTGATVDAGNALASDPDAMGFSAVVADSPILFVDNSSASIIEDGSYLNPYTTIAAALSQTSATRSTVYVAAGAAPYTENLYLSDGDRLWGEHYRDLGIGGGSYAVVNGSGIHVTAANDTVIRGFEFRNPGTAITIVNVDNVTVRDNFVDATISRGTAVNIRADDGQLHQGFLIEGNHFLWNVFGINVGADAAGSLTGIRVESNLVDTSFFGIYMYNNGGVVEMLLQQNTLAPWFAGAWMTQSSTPGLQTTVDFGGGSLGSIGYNRFLSGSGYIMGGPASVTRTAQFNWWGQASGPAPGQVNGAADSSNWLSMDPAP